MASSGTELSTDEPGAHRLYPWSDEAPIVVSGNEDHFPVWPQPPSECAQYRRGHRQSVLGIVI